MGNYNSGEFDPGANSRPYPNGVGIYNNERLVANLPAKQGVDEYAYTGRARIAIL
jgi:hypothetical protein